MKRQFSLWVGVSVLVMVALACNLPVGGGQPTAQPTPNATLTALFALLTPVATTPPPVIASPTAAPPTAVPPTPTTAAASPTATLPQPTLTATPLLRSGGSFKAVYFNTPPKLDGVWDEWPGSAYSCENVVFGAKERKNREDLGCSFRVGWDGTYLYVAYKIYDDVYVQEASGADLYKGDSVEILFDADLYGDWNSQVLSGDDYQLGISLGRPDPEGTKDVYLWFPRTKAGGRDDVKVAVAAQDGLYRVEVAVPWSLFGVKPASNQQYGFAVSASDNDKPGEKVQQSMVSSAPFRRLTDPTTWGILTLTR